MIDITSLVLSQFFLVYLLYRYIQIANQKDENNDKDK